MNSDSSNNNSTMNMESFKIYFGSNNENIRRVSLPKDNYDEVVKQLYGIYKDESLYHGELRIQYMDNEGDKITVSSQGEWEEMFEAAGELRPIKLWIVEGMNPRGYFKDGPAPEPVGLVVDGKNTVPITGDVANTVSIVVDCLKGIFPGGLILPYNLPKWLKDSNAVSLRPVAGAQQPTEDFVVDLTLLAEAMRRQAFSNIRSDSTRDQLSEAKVFLETVVALFPNDANSWYNLACAHALLGNSDLAVSYLDKAHEAGYTNIDHMQKDSDLDSLRNMEHYKDLVKRMSGQQNMDEDKSEKLDDDIVKEFEQLKVVEPSKECKADPQQQQPSQYSDFSSLVPFLLQLGVGNPIEAMELLKRYNGNVEMAVNDFYSRD